MSQKLLFLVNPCAGKRKAAEELSDILQIFCAYDYLPTVLMTEYPGHATELCRQYAKEYDLVACAGGDGTLNETISGLLSCGADLPIAYLPCGTTNDLASTLGLSHDLTQAAKEAVTGRDRWLDIGSFNGRSFVYTASFGAFTKASYDTPQNVKNALGHLAYILEGIKGLGAIRPIHAKVRTEEGEFEGDYIFGSVSNTTSLAGIITIDEERVQLDDGKFELLLVDTPQNAIDTSKLILQATQARFGDMLKLYSAAHIEVDTGENTDWTLDGEQEKGETRFVIDNLPRAVRLRVPAQA
jgi:lipid kinase, YegS/Rv2252/BmrU family